MGTSSNKVLNGYIQLLDAIALVQGQSLNFEINKPQIKTRNSYNYRCLSWSYSGLPDFNSQWTGSRSFINYERTFGIESSQMGTQAVKDVLRE
jgi:hypothetical protein